MSACSLVVPRDPWLVSSAFSRSARRVCVALILLLLSLATTTSAFALDRTYTLSQYQHTTWTEREGAPTNVQGIAQTLDGYLWIASARGLYRFDGASFEPVRSLGGISLAAETVVSVLAAPTGELVLNLGRRGAAVFTHGRLLTFSTCALGPSVTSDDKRAWMLCNRRPVRVVDDHLEPVDASWGYPDHDASMLGRDGEGRIWTAVDGAILSLEVGSHTFRSSSVPVSGASVVAPNGSIWFLGANGVSVTTTSKGVPLRTEMVSRRLFDMVHVDRDGGVWASDSRGIVHVGDVSRLLRNAKGDADFSDTMSRQSGLSSDTVSAMFEDSRGNVWVGTPAGLERFRDNALRPFRLPGRSLAFSVAAGRSGELWVANYIGHLMRFAGGDVREYGQIGPGISCIARDVDGSVWVAADNGKLWHLDDGKVVGVLQVPLEIHGSMVTSITRATTGDLWIGSTVNGLVGSYANGRWTTPGGHAGLPERWNSRTILADAQGRLWASSKRTDILMVRGSAVTKFAAADGVKVGDISAIVERGPHLWVGGSKGVAYYDGRAFKTLDSTSDNAFVQINGLLESSNGDLWVHEYDAVVRVPAAEVAKVMDNPAYRVKTERYDALDGLYGTSPLSAARATVAEGSDGLVWFSTSEGVMSIDPARPRVDAGVPKVYVQSIDIDGVARESSNNLALAPRTRSVRFLYTAVSPGAAERVRFRYRLDGFDDDWRDVGSRRAVTYTSLPAGRYRFRVASSDDAGDWVENETSIDFRVEAIWFESVGFRVLYVALGLASIWALYRFRLERATRRVRWQMRMRQAERDRIARDLHDTLLQGIHGLTWRIQTTINGIASSDPVREKLELALDIAEDLLTESRRRVLTLRENSRTSGSLSEAVRDVASSVSTAHPATYELQVKGEEVAINDMAQMDICDIVREAFLNAISHGRATRVELSLDYSADAVTLRVKDNGCGMDPIFIKGGRPGHWGLMGMRERARELGGVLRISSEAGEGTEVSVRLRGTRVFRNGRRRFDIVERVASAFRALRSNRK